MRSVRENIRRSADMLRPGEWATLDSIHRMLPEPKPTKAYLGVALSNMVYARQMRKKRAPAGSGKGVRFIFSSGTKPVIDARSLRKGVPLKHRKRLGFAALARLKEKNPEAWKREVRRDTARGRL